MATEEIVKSRPKSSRHYSSGAPWLFRGSALYQLHLVKSEIARSFIPKELRLVEAFGYTLGGLFLACYEDSPAGAFDELVVISGIVWNPPTSCAWAARVLVNSEEACRHGRKEVGLPSQVAIFSERINRSLEKPANKSRGFLGFHRIGSYFCNPKESSELHITEIHGSTKAALCSIALPFSGPAPIERWTGPKIRMSLPSFSGKTRYNPSLLKYSCQIECRVQTVEPAKLSATTSDNMESILDHQNTEGGERGALSSENDSWNRCISILLSKPILALRFNCLKMLVHAPSHVLPPSKKGIREPHKGHIES